MYMYYLLLTATSWRSAHPLDWVPTNGKKKGVSASFSTLGWDGVGGLCFLFIDELLWWISRVYGILIYMIFFFFLLSGYALKTC